MQSQLFPSEVGLDPRCLLFAHTPLGQLRSVLPIKDLAALLPDRSSNKGPAPLLNNEAKIALQFLKAREGCSDARLLERLNSDWALQLFYGLLLRPNQQIKDKDLIWTTRQFVAQHFDIKAFQSILIERWKPHLEDTESGFSDASCFESYIKFPTDVKLLWDCILYLHAQIKYHCKLLGLKKPRNKFKEQRTKQLVYSQTKRKTYKMKRRRTKALLYLLHKLLSEWAQVLSQQEQQAHTELIMVKNEDRLLYISKVYKQQRFMYENPGQYPKDRIVSLYKPYLRPIVRGKENKRVEFGAKVNTWMVGGLNFIEHFSFDAFHEGIRLKNGIAFHQKHFGRLRRLGADRLYATNVNRRFCKRFNISTNFKPKGRPKADPDIRKQERKMRRLIGKVRATVLEGSYGNEKNHYGLRKVKARNEKTERLWVFFGMMTANAVKVSHLKNKKAKAPPSTLAA